MAGIPVGPVQLDGSFVYGMPQENAEGRSLPGEQELGQRRDEGTQDDERVGARGQDHVLAVALLLTFPVEGPQPRGRSRVVERPDEGELQSGLVVAVPAGV